MITRTKRIDAAVLQVSNPTRTVLEVASKLIFKGDPIKIIFKT